MISKTHTFTIEQDGKIYHCASEIKGNPILTQTIYVNGFGSKPDSLTYGKTKHSASAMRTVAKRIALEIIKGL